MLKTRPTFFHIFWEQKDIHELLRIHIGNQWNKGKLLTNTNKRRQQEINLLVHYILLFSDCNIRREKKYYITFSYLHIKLNSFPHIFSQKSTPQSAQGSRAMSPIQCDTVNELISKANQYIKLWTLYPFRHRAYYLWFVYKNWTNKIALSKRRGHRGRIPLAHWAYAGSHTKKDYHSLDSYYQLHNVLATQYYLSWIGRFERQKTN